MSSKVIPSAITALPELDHSALTALEKKMIKIDSQIRRKYPDLVSLQEYIVNTDWDFDKDWNKLSLLEKVECDYIEKRNKTS